MIMHNRRLTTVKAILLFIIILVFSKTSYADEDQKRNSFWGAVDAGAGHVNLTFNDSDESDTLFYLGFTAGYTINPNFLFGIELSGWLYETANLDDPTKGDGLSQVLIITRYYPYKENNIFVKVGGGYISHWNNEPGATTYRNGWALSVGGGYDIAVGSKWSITPSILYNYGEVENQNHNAFTISVGITWY